MIMLLTALILQIAPPITDLSYGPSDYSNEEILLGWTVHPPITYMNYQITAIDNGEYHDVQPIMPMRYFIDQDRFTIRIVDFNTDHPIWLMVRLMDSYGDYVTDYSNVIEILYSPKDSGTVHQNPLHCSADHGISSDWLWIILIVCFVLSGK